MVSGSPQPQTALGELLRELKASTGLTLKELTVLTEDNDPYRLDTPACHRKAAWFRDQMLASGLLNRENPLHLRGIHYVIVSRPGVIRPDGQPYRNDEKSWLFLQDEAAKAARWLGYVPFHAIRDARNAEPVIQIAGDYSGAPWPYTGVIGLGADELDRLPLNFGAFVQAQFNAPPQPYRIAIFGEKTSLEDVLRPIASIYGTDLYLPSGEISDTQIAMMARSGASGRRELVVIALTDCDPWGYQMANSIGHKLRALRDSKFPDLRFRLIAPCLTAEQVKRLGLPSTPLKPDPRAAGWVKRYGVEQTEIDALATLQPRVLREIVEDAIKPYFDATLKHRVERAQWKWHDKARAILHAALEKTDFDSVREEAGASLRLFRDAIREYSERLQNIVQGLRLEYPPAEIPEPQLDEPPDPLVSSDMDLADAISILKDRKDYSA